jgi:hypothetical protein
LPDPESPANLPPHLTVDAAIAACPQKAAAHVSLATRPTVFALRGPRITTASRWTLAAITVACLVVLAVAGRLRPSPLGHGTHTQLGLPPCSFRVATGLPCPSCGMTTAFAWTVRGRIDQAWAANPAGLVFCLSVVALVPWALGCAVSGRTWIVRSLDDFLVWFVLTGLGLALATWALRLFLGR